MTLNCLERNNMEIKQHKDYRAEMRCIDDEYIGMTEVNLYDDKGRHMYTSCQIEDCAGPDFFAIMMFDMSEWCINNKEPRLKLGDKILWYKIG